ncbi:hypothetical protein RRG08_000595 [Elysia crispata]|uniref:Uncharacterized protein n=1 Tax=Elysia crispata TaxID=231223 RepID=A0AAE0Y8B2_9GAST|nr:hypothetical protein RRG08_000595 [Elysia crispata]
MLPSVKGGSHASLQEVSSNNGIDLAVALAVRAKFRANQNSCYGMRTKSVEIADKLRQWKSQNAPPETNYHFRLGQKDYLW